WGRGYNVKLKRNHGFSRTIPAVTEEFVLTIGPRHHVMCVNRETGKFLWGLDIEKKYGGEQPMWYAGQCPLIDENLAIIATGGKALLIAVDCATGEIIWETPNTDNWRLSHSSVMPWILYNRKMYVYSAIGGLIGVAANGEDAGKILWKSSAWNHKVIAPSPVCMKDGKIFLTAGYGVGSMMLQLSENNGEYSVNVLDEYIAREGLSCEQQTPVFENNHLFGIIPNGGGALRNQLVCVHPSNPKKIVWSSGKEHRFGLGPYFIADGKLFILNDDGTLYIAKSSTQNYIELDHAEVIQNGRDAWAPMALANGYLVLRDEHTMVCVDLRI
ncbi:MAG: PQQ-binding-like beta-propeller repeat protein, partial [Bacteroidota bacterium]